MFRSTDNLRSCEARQSRRKRSADLKAKIDEARQLGLNGDYTDHLIELYKQRALYEATGINLKLSEQEIILRNEELKNYSSREIKRMVPYFRFSDNHLTIGTSTMQSLYAIAIPVLFLAIAGFYFYESETGFAYDYWFPLTMGIIHGLIMLLSYVRITIPFFLARRLKKRLNSCKKSTTAAVHYE